MVQVSAADATDLHIFNQHVVSEITDFTDQLEWKRADSLAVMTQCTVEYLSSDQQIYSVNRSSSARVWNSEAKSSLNISSYRKAAPYIPALLGSDEPYMDWLSDQLTQECTAHLIQSAFIQFECPVIISCFKNFLHGC